MTIHSPTQRAGLMRLPILAIASALLALGFALGQMTPNLTGMIGSTLDSAQTQTAAPALTSADDYVERHLVAAPAFTSADDYVERHTATVPALTSADDYVERHFGQ
jgi:hypothetical protein